jgi:hypothetical protein
MEVGQFRRQPIINIVFELPSGGWKYVHSWIQKENRPYPILELNKESLDNPPQLICQILRTWNECEKLWTQYTEEKIREFEKALFQKKQTNPFMLLQFDRKRKT